MTKTKYLYGVDMSWFEDMTETEAIKERIRLSKRLIRVQNQSHYMTRDDDRVRALLKAIKHNEQLLRE